MTLYCAMDLKAHSASLQRLLALLAFLLCAGTTHADPRFQALWENYGRAQGLPSGQVSSFAQDARGYLYAGTDRGLTKFDGRSFAILKTEPALPLEAVEFLRFDERGKLWATVNGFGVCVIDQLNLPVARSRCLSKSAESLSHRLPDNQVFTLESWRGRMWLAVFGHGLLEVELDTLATGKLHPFPDNRLLSSAIWQDALLVGSLDGALYHFEPQLGSRKIVELDEAANLIAANGKRAFITLLLSNQLLEIDAELRLSKHEIAGVKSISSFTLHDGKLLLSTDVGLILGSPETNWQQLKSFGSALGAMPEGRINTLFFDQQNGLWVGSRTAGAGRLNSLSSPLTWLLRGDGGLPTNTVNAADMANDGRLWVATSTRGALAFYPDGTQSSLPIDANDGVPTKNTRAVRTIGETVWIGHQMGLTQHRPNSQTGRFSHWQSSGELSLVDQIEPTPDGGAWISVGFSQLVRLDASLNELDRIQAPGESTVIEQFLVTTDESDVPKAGRRNRPAAETIWWADDAGFHVRKSPGEPAQSLSNEQGLGVTRCPKSGHVWFFGRHALIAVDPSTLTLQKRLSYKVEASSDVGGIWCGLDDTLYFAGNSGLWRWHLQDAKPERLDSFENAAEMSERPLHAADNALLVAGPRGLLRVDLDKLADAEIAETSAASKAFALHITERPPNRLNWQENAASLSADALSLHSPERTQYQFVARSDTKLLETSEWSTQHQHRFERLPAGSIQFEVKAKNAAGLIVAAPAILTEVEQVPWRRPIAILLMFGLSALAIHSLYRFRLSRHRREASLREAELRAAQKSELALVRTESLSVIAHEMRNLLNGVGTSAELLRRHPDSELAPRWLTRVESASEGLGRLLDDALDFTKIATGHGAIMPRSTDVARLIVDCVEAFHPRASEKLLTISATVSMDAPIREIDPVRLRQIASNLINNAIKFTDEGEICVRLSEVLVPKTDLSALVLEVEDTGIGIPESARARIFEPYARLNTERQGSGLGLAIVATLAEACGGKISIMPTATGKGSLFRLLLPAPIGELTATVDELAPRDPITSEPANPSTSDPVEVDVIQPLISPVLIIEDNCADLAALSLVLTSFGFTTINCQSAFDALIVAQSTEVSAVLLDLDLADMDGFDLAQTLRLMPAFAQTPLIALTGSSENIIQERCQEVGINAIELKPFDAERLKAALWRLLRLDSTQVEQTEKPPSTNGL